MSVVVFRVFNTLTGHREPRRFAFESAARRQAARMGWMFGVEPVRVIEADERDAQAYGMGWDAAERGEPCEPPPTFDESERRCYIIGFRACGGA